MKAIGLCLLLILTMTIQSTVIPLVAIFDVVPDFVLIFVVFVALRHGAVAGVFCGFAAGLIEDVYGPVEFMGAAALSKGAVGYIVGQLEEKFLKLDLITKIAVLGVGFFLSEALYVLAVQMDREAVASMFLYQSLPEGVYTLLIGTLAFYFLYPQRDFHAP
jgi:rod shape-determining protein MreD